MATGDPQCPRCGSHWCIGIIDVCPKEELVSLRDKTIKNFESSEKAAYDVGKKASKWDAEMFITAYIGDDFFARKFVECMDLIKRKNADYSQGEQKGDRIAAFKRIAKDIDITPEKAWAVLCQKHWGAVMKYVKDGIVESEPIEGRITDIINYMILLAAIIEGKKEAE